jgi:hypothetical protein
MISAGAALSLTGLLSVGATADREPGDSSPPHAAKNIPAVASARTTNQVDFFIAFMSLTPFSFPSVN